MDSGENILCHFQEKVSRLDRMVAEHSQFSLGIKELQDWMMDAVHMLDSYCHPTSDKSVLDSRMLKLEVGISREISLTYRICFSQNFSSSHLSGVITLQCLFDTYKLHCWCDPVCIRRPCLNIPESFDPGHAHPQIVHKK